MHEYSCKGGNRDKVYLATLVISAMIAFGVMYLIDWLVGGIHIVLDFLIFVISLGPLTFWALFAKRYSGLLLKLSGVPNCSGVYKGTLKSVYDKFKEEYPVTITINHQFRMMEIIVKTETSESLSKTATVKLDGNRVEIVYTYENRGSMEKGLNRHIGTCILTIEGKQIYGQYYTHPDRSNYGEINASKD